MPATSSSLLSHLDYQVPDAGKKESPKVQYNGTYRPPLHVIGAICAAGLVFIFQSNFARLLLSPNNFLQSKWNMLIDTFGEDQRPYWVYGTTLVIVVMYWGIGLLYLLMDVFNKPDFLRRYKMQPGTNEPVETTKLLKVVFHVLVNQIVIGIPVIHSSFNVIEWRGIPHIRELPSLGKIAFDLVVMLFVYEFAFYYTHRMLHSRYLYKYIHKRHHEWTSPIAITAMYCHPVEHIVSNMFSPVLGTIVIRPHLLTTWLWACYVILLTLSDHSGYHLPFVQSPESHDFHHHKFTQCYGVLGLLDRLHGTDSMFRDSIVSSRNHMILNLKSARETYPDQTKSS